MGSDPAAGASTGLVMASFEETAKQAEDAKAAAEQVARDKEQAEKDRKAALIGDASASRYSPRSVSQSQDPCVFWCMCITSHDYIVFFPSQYKR